MEDVVVNIQFADESATIEICNISVISFKKREI